MTYRIATEDLNRKTMEDIISTRFDGFTAIPAIGYYKGQKEDSIVFEIVTDNKQAVYDVAEEIRFTNQQDSVLVTEIPGEYKFITVKGGTE